MLRNVLLLVIFTFGISGFLFSQTVLEGKVTDNDTGEPILYGNVAVYKDGRLITGAETDFDGKYSVTSLDPGTYDVEASYLGYNNSRVTSVVVESNRINTVNIQLISDAVVLEEVVVREFKAPLIRQDETTSGAIVTGEKIRTLPTKDVNKIVGVTAGASTIDGGAVSMRGSRTDATEYIIDGMRVSGRMIPTQEIEQMEVITGGIPAMHGDVTGGLVTVSTKGPSNSFSGGLELETSQYLDPYGYNLGNLYLSGPIIKNSKDQSILGFRFGANVRYQKDDDPPATGVYRAPENTISRIEENPITFLGVTPLNSAEFLKDAAIHEDGEVTLMDYSPNEDRLDIDLTGKLDLKIAKGLDLAVSGSYNNRENRFTPGGWGLLNWTNNPTFNSEVLRGTFRIKHRVSANASSEDMAMSLIRNFTWTLQGGLEQTTQSVSDLDHEENFFRYGHVGDYGITWDPVFGIADGDTTGLPSHIGYLETFNSYAPGVYNPVTSNYNTLNFELNEHDSKDDFIALNGGLRSNQYDDVWSISRISNVGQVYNNYNTAYINRYSGSFTTGFDLYPVRGSETKHNVQLGFTYEQRITGNYDLFPSGLWTQARLIVNDHLKSVNTENIIGYSPDSIPIYSPISTPGEGSKFYQSVRSLVGKGETEYVNIDEIHPDSLSIDMFAPFELSDQGLVGLYYGHDYLGNQVSDLTFDDFFTEQNRDMRGVAAYRPIYMGGYLQDKFRFRDIIFRLGVRWDRWDANTKVPKDPYSLYQVQNAKDFYNETGDDRPSGVDDDFLVYIESPENQRVKGFRQGEQWYNAEGESENDGINIFGGGNVYPKYYDNLVNDIKSLDFNTSTSFEDYTPENNIMPRLAFSFPISTDANFFAHYDILVQRPTSNVYMSPLSYYYFEDAGRTGSNNPNLKTQKTIDYEVGFQQKLSNSSAFKLQAYYKEIRDMIALRTLLHVASPVTEYNIYDNLDFGTVKGFTFSYDLRRTNNVELLASYTLQFADGTGSDPNSQAGLTSRGNIRTLSPLSFDERHSFLLVMDYRYGRGKSYNGPVVRGVNILENFGINMQSSIVSGRPFTKRDNATPFGGTGFQGSINGTRKPWRYNIDARANKSFRIGGPKGINMNLYLNVENLLNTRNQINVYPVTGSPDDDGYLSSTQGISSLNNIKDTRTNTEANEILYQEAYQWALLSPNNYSLPRRIRLGLIFDF
jgi:hypothetical protein